ncbi:hypothetical protein ACSBR2_015324 [Camellia fascicularis]
MVNPHFLNQTDATPFWGLRAGETYQCYDIKILTGNHTGIWQEQDPVSHSLPIFIMQLIIITSLTRLLIFILRPFRQPRIVPEIIAGALMSPSIMGRISRNCTFFKAAFSVSGVMTLETMGNIGLIYFLFLLGLEIDLTTISRVGRQAFTFALTGTIVPFAIGVALYYLFLPELENVFQLGCIVWGVSLTVTGLPVIAQILTKLKLLYTDIGKTAMSSALVNEMFSWILLTVVVALGNSEDKYLLVLLGTIGFVLFCTFAIRPIIIWKLSQSQKGGYPNDETICVILVMVLACGLTTDLLGTNSLVGAFVFGLIIPSGLLGPRFVEVFRGFVEDFLMPVFFAISGFRTNFDSIGRSSTWYLVGLTMTFACLCKVVSTLVISFFFGMPLREGMALGVLMNTKGLLALIVINYGRDRVVLEDEAFTVMMISILLMIMATQPIMSILYKPTKRFLYNKHRAIQSLKPDAELRMVVCLHESHSVSGIINILQASNPSRRSPITVFALQLVQLTGHTTALLIVHGPTRSNSQKNNSYENAIAAHILDGFERLEEQHNGVSVQPMTVVSPYTTMHEDICSIAEEKGATLIILPFHQRLTIHNKMEDIHHAYKDVNDNVLLNSPCSVGILVDRGFGSLTEIDAEAMMRHIAMLYIGGPDDREALCYARKMAGHPNITLTVVRFVESKHDVGLKLADFIEDTDDDDDDEDEEDKGEDNEKYDNEDKEKKVSITETIDVEAEMRLDESFISEFRHRTTGDRSIMYLEKEVSNGSETVQTIKLVSQGYDLFVVGRRAGFSSRLTEGLDLWSECPELGTIGDLLVTSDFSSNVSVLVVKQYVGARHVEEGLGTSGIINPQTSVSSFEPISMYRDMDGAH